MGYGKLGRQNYPNRNEAYFCSICLEFNDPFRGTVERMRAMLEKNICERCAKKANEKRFV